VWEFVVQRASGNCYSRIAIQAALIGRERAYAGLVSRVQFDMVKRIAADAQQMGFITSRNWGRSSTC